ncbi:MAG TPA: hypothetical protein VHD76_20790 [Bryobacteraceae bacterium]|nr:hypothetical protein [Bryobacteraceae bacterium]HVY18891.1 hypothetical protein [Bauldia sp.]
MIRLLGALPESLEEELFEKLREIERNYRERRWEPAELNGGKLCEVAYCILRGHADGTFPAKSHKPSNFYDACVKMEKEPASLGRSVRIQLPRMLIALYEIRNGRNVGHVGGDVDPNQMDAACVLQMAKWVVAELVRIFHGVKFEEAAALIEAISEREISLIWDAGTVRRVLDNSLSMLEKTLVLLFSSAQPLSEEQLIKSLEHSNPSVYRRDVLRRAHSDRLIEYDERTKSVKISPLGIKRVEDQILPNAKV